MCRVNMISSLASPLYPNGFMCRDWPASPSVLHGCIKCMGCQHGFCTKLLPVNTGGL